MTDSGAGLSSFTRGMLVVFVLPLIVGIVLILCWVVPVIFFDESKFEAIENEGQTYLSKTLPKILSTWSIVELEQEAGPELSKLNENEDVKGLFEKYSRKLGKVKNLGVPVKTAAKSFFDLSKDRFRTEYLFHAAFEKGNADVTSAIIRSRGTWHIASTAVRQ